MRNEFSPFEVLALPRAKTFFVVSLAVSELLGIVLLSQFVPGDLVFGIGALVVAFGAVVTQWPFGALLTVVVASVMPRFFVALFGWKARPEHFAVVMVSLAVFVWHFGSNRKMRLETLDYWVFAYIAMNYVSSAFGSSSPANTLRWALLSNLAVVPYFLIRLLVRDAETLRRAFQILLAVGIAESAYGILCYLSHYALRTAAGMEIGQYFSDIAAPYGSLYEPNLFGAYTACSAVMALAVYLTGQRRLGYLTCFVVASLAAVLSFSRAALLALVVTAGWTAWQARHARQEHRARTATLVLAVGLTLLVVVLAVGSVVKQRFGDLFNRGLTEETTITRLIEAKEALQEFSEHPLVGSGTASFQLSFDWAKYVTEWRGDRTWVGNIIVRLLHDTGLLGLVTVLGFLVSLGRKVRLGLRQKTGQAAMLVALSAGALLYAISFQATDGTLETFPWIHLGLLSSAAILAGCSRENSNAMSSAAGT